MADKSKVRKSQVQQAPAQDANINSIVRKHMAGPGRFGQPIGNPNATRQPRFMDMPSESYHEMLNRVADIGNQFRALPARLRAVHGNDPYQLLRWLENPANRKEAIIRGLLVPTEDEAIELDRERANAFRRDLTRDPNQLDLEEQATQASADLEGQQPPRTARTAPQADPEAQPRHHKKGGSRTA